MKRNTRILLFFAAVMYVWLLLTSAILRSPPDMGVRATVVTILAIDCLMTIIIPYAKAWHVLLGSGIGLLILTTSFSKGTIGALTFLIFLIAAGLSTLVT